MPAELAESSSKASNSNLARVGETNSSVSGIKENSDQPVLAESMTVSLPVQLDQKTEVPSTESSDPLPQLDEELNKKLMKLASEESEPVACSSKSELPEPKFSSESAKLKDRSRSRSRKRSHNKSRSRSRGRKEIGRRRSRGPLQGFYFSRYEVMKQRILNTPIKNFQKISQLAGMSNDGFFNCEGTNIGIPGADKNSDSDEFVLPPLNLRVIKNL